MASVSAGAGTPDTAGALVVFASPRVDHDRRDVEFQKRLITNAFAGPGWHVPRMLAAPRDVPDLYFDSISALLRTRTVRRLLVSSTKSVAEKGNLPDYASLSSAASTSAASVRVV